MQVPETERKYDLDLEQELPSLDEAFDDSVHVERMPSIRLDATYFDTDDRRLLRTGITLRKRLGGGDEGWHVKVPSGTRWTRTEIQEPLGNPHSLEVPTTLSDLILAATRGRRLRPVAEIHTQRTIECVIDDSGATLIEVADDVVRARALSGGRLRTWREIEVEVGSGGERAAETMHRFLKSRGIQESAEGSKLATTLDYADPAEETPGRRRGGALDAILRGLSAQVEELAARDLDLRRGDDDEAVHDMRVASRRLRSCLRAFARCLRLDDSDRLQEELRWIAGVLGDSRDGEVLQARLEERARAQLSDRDLSVVRHVLDSYFTAARAQASSTLNAALRSDRYVRLLNDLYELVAELSRPGGPEFTKKAVFRGVRRELDRARRRVAEGRTASGDERDVLMHKARKAAKRARYAAEVARPLSPHRAAQVAERCEKAQESLGARQDAVLAMALLRRLALAHEAGFNPETERKASFAFGVLEGCELAEISDIDQHVDEIEGGLAAAHL